MHLNVETSDQFPFTREEVEEVAWEVMPENLRNKSGEIKIIDSSQEDQYFDPFIKGDIAGMEHHMPSGTWVLILSTKLGGKYLSAEIPYNTIRSKSQIKEGYSPYEEYEQARDELASNIAHEMRHIEDAKERGVAAYNKRNGTEQELEAEAYAQKALRENIRGLPPEQEKG